LRHPSSDNTFTPTGNWPFFRLLSLSIIGLSLFSNSAASAQERLGERFARYQAERKEKGSALAWSLVLPGGGLFYAGNGAKYGAGIGLIETASLGGVIYLQHQHDSGSAVRGDAGMKVFFCALYLLSKIVEVSHAFTLVDRSNEALWQSIFGGPREGPEPLGALHAQSRDMRFTVLLPF
jgi:hypothetical protein